MKPKLEAKKESNDVFILRKEINDLKDDKMIDVPLFYVKQVILY